MNWLAAAALLSSLPLSGALVSVSTGGVFNSLVPTTSWSASGDTWSLSFDIDTNPAVSQVVVGTATTPGGFDPVITNFVYDLNGAAVNVSAVEIYYYNTDYYGLFSVCFFGCNINVDDSAPVNGFIFEGPQAYSGSEAAPTILTGDFAENNTGGAGLEVFVASTEYDQTLGMIDQLDTAPEPSTVALIAAGLLMLAVLRARRTAQR